LRCPNNAVTLMLVGDTNPNLPIPGLCTPTLYVSPILIVVGIANASGTMILPNTNIPFDPALIGATIFSQAFSDDPGQAVLPFAASQGVRSVISNPSPYRIIRIYAPDVNATSGMKYGDFYPFGMVVRFTHR
jgi:hypothetical protein